MPTNFERAVLDLSESLGLNGMPALSDEHIRWELYQKALDEPVHHSALVRVLRDDPNSPLVSAVVVRALELIPSWDRTRWLELLPHGSQRSFADSRAIELDRLQRLIDIQSDVDVDVDDIESWSRWLQLQVAENVSNRAVLDRLADVGGTKRVRHLARQRRDSK